MEGLINSLCCGIPQVMFGVIPLVVAFVRGLANPEKRKALRKIAHASVNTADERERSEIIQKIVDDELKDQRPRSEKKSPGPVERLVDIFIAGIISFAFLKNPDSLGQFPENWLILICVFTFIGVLIWRGLALPPPSLNILREIWAERFEEEVDLSDVEVPPTDGWTEEELLRRKEH
jgi:hypothetical protein